MRIGLFGGSFDPVHYGHLLLAEWAREQASLDEVWLIPAAQAPHKATGPQASGGDRAQMLELACADNPALKVCRLELERGGISYTALTLREIKASRPLDELFFLMGADSLVDLPSWREPEAVCSLATPLVAKRPAVELDFSPLAGIADPTVIERARQMQLQMPVVEFSSSELRQRVNQGKSLRYQTPPAVIAYIESERLYRELS